MESDRDAVDVSLEAPRHARASDRVPITLTIRNGRARFIGLATVGHEITFDILVTRDGELVWRRLEGQTVALALQIRMMRPGEMIELRDVWHATVDAGRYEVTGIMLTDADPLETAPVSVEIVDM
jgi:hypothetical protein